MKRKISDVSGNNSGPIPEKRRKVELTSMRFKETMLRNPDDWFMKSRDGRAEIITQSKEVPKLLSSEDGINIFEITYTDGYTGEFATIEKNSTNWYQGKNISWINLSGGEDKRKISDVHGNKSDPIPTKVPKLN